MEPGNGDRYMTQRDARDMEGNLKTHFDSAIERLEEKVVLRVACRERHRLNWVLLTVVIGLVGERLIARIA